MWKIPNHFICRSMLELMYGSICLTKTVSLQPSFIVKLMLHQHDNHSLSSNLAWGRVKV